MSDKTEQNVLEKLRFDLNTLNHINDTIDNELSEVSFIKICKRIGKLMGEITWNENDPNCIRNIHGYRNRLRSKSNKPNHTGAKINFEVISNLKYLNDSPEDPSNLAIYNMLDRLEADFANLKIKLETILFSNKSIIEDDECRINLESDELNNESKNDSIDFLVRVSAIIGLKYFFQIIVNFLNELLNTHNGVDTNDEKNLTNKTYRLYIGYILFQVGEQANHALLCIKPEIFACFEKSQIEIVLVKLVKYRKMLKAYPKIIYGNNYALLNSMYSKMIQIINELILVFTKIILFFQKFERDLYKIEVSDLNTFENENAVSLKQITHTLGLDSNSMMLMDVENNSLNYEASLEKFMSSQDTFKLIKCLIAIIKFDCSFESLSLDYLSTNIEEIKEKIQAKKEEIKILKKQHHASDDSDLILNEWSRLIVMLNNIKLILPKLNQAFKSFSNSDNKMGSTVTIKEFLHVFDESRKLKKAKDKESSIKLETKTNANQLELILSNKQLKKDLKNLLLNDGSLGNRLLNEIDLILEDCLETCSKNIDRPSKIQNDSNFKKMLEIKEVCFKLKTLNDINGEGAFENGFENATFQCLNNLFDKYHYIDTLNIIKPKLFVIINEAEYLNKIYNNHTNSFDSKSFYSYASKMSFGIIGQLVKEVFKTDEFNEYIQIYYTKDITFYRSMNKNIHLRNILVHHFMQKSQSNFHEATNITPWIANFKALLYIMLYNSNLEIPEELILDRNLLEKFNSLNQMHEMDILKLIWLMNCHNRLTQYEKSIDIFKSNQIQEYLNNKTNGSLVLQVNIYKEYIFSLYAVDTCSNVIKCCAKINELCQFESENFSFKYKSKFTNLAKCLADPSSSKLIKKESLQTETVSNELKDSYFPIVYSESLLKQGETEKAFDIVQALIKSYEVEKDHINGFNAYKILAICYKNMNCFEECIDSLNKALNILDSNQAAFILPYGSYINTFYSTIICLKVEAYFEQSVNQPTNESNEHFQECIDLANESLSKYFNNNQSVDNINFAIINIYLGLSQLLSNIYKKEILYSKSLVESYLEKADDALGKIRNPKHNLEYAEQQINLCQAYELTNNTTKALECLDKIFDNIHFNDICLNLLRKNSRIKIQSVFLNLILLAQRNSLENMKNVFLCKLFKIKRNNQSGEKICFDLSFEITKLKLIEKFIKSHQSKFQAFKSERDESNLYIFLDCVLCYIYANLYEITTVEACKSMYSKKSLICGKNAYNICINLESESEDSDSNDESVNSNSESEDGQSNNDSDNYDKEKHETEINDNVDNQVDVYESNKFNKFISKKVFDKLFIFTLYLVKNATSNYIKFTNDEEHSENLKKEIVEYQNEMDYLLEEDTSQPTLSLLVDIFTLDFFSKNSSHDVIDSDLFIVNTFVAKILIKSILIVNGIKKKFIDMYFN